MEKIQLKHRFIFNLGTKPIVVRKVIRNGQPEETGDNKKDIVKTAETLKQEPMEIETDKKDKPRLKPSVKPKVSI